MIAGGTEAAVAEFAVAGFCNMKAMSTTTTLRRHQDHLTKTGMDL